jgi:hypothetical protein
LFDCGQRAAVSDPDDDGRGPNADLGSFVGTSRAVEESYVVDIKRSARRASRGAGEWVRDEGRVREFDSKAAAREWAAGLDGDRTVWVQDAVPQDGSGVDGYLVARRYDPERSRAREQAAATAQTPLGSRE